MPDNATPHNAPRGLVPPNTCCLCFETLPLDQLEPVSDEPGKVWDVCRECAKHEKEAGAVY